jgi:hypothetical protein
MVGLLMGALPLLFLKYSNLASLFNFFINPNFGVGSEWSK